MLLTSIAASLTLALALQSSDTSQEDTWAGRQPWPVIATAGARALGFAPLPASPRGALGTELLFVQRRIFSLHLGAELGAFAQPAFARGLALDATLLPRLTAPFGLYGDLGLSLGGQASRVPGVVYRAKDGERLRASKAPVTVAARVGLAASLGYDFGATTRVPVRLFVRYRQLLQTPFMPGNDLPAMGVAELSGGLAFSFGTWRTRR